MENEKWESKGIINKQPAKEIISRFDTTEKVNKELQKLKLNWEELLGAYHLESGDPRLDRMVNIWNQYQCMVTFNMSRSASFFESGIGQRYGFQRLEPGPHWIYSPSTRASKRTNFRYRPQHKKRMGQPTTNTNR